MQFQGRQIDCITFDLDDTLWPCLPVIQNAELVFYTWLEQNYPQITKDFNITTLTEHRRTCFALFPDMAHDFSWLRRQWLKKLVQEYQCPSQLVEDGFGIYLRARNDVTLFSGAHQVLEQVSKRFRCGSITNGNADINMVGIGHFFDFEITAANAGAAKPSPVIFAAAVEAAGVSPERILHIGDDMERDMRGAARAGLNTLWINPQGIEWAGECKPNAELRTIAELPDFVLNTLH